MDCEKNPFLQMSQDQIQKLDAVLSSEQARALLQATNADKLFSDPKLEDVLSHDEPIIGPMEEGKLPAAIEETLNLGVSLTELEHLVLDQASGSGIFSENPEVADILEETQCLVSAIWLDHNYCLSPPDPKEAEPVQQKVELPDVVVPLTIHNEPQCIGASVTVVATSKPEELTISSGLPKTSISSVNENDESRESPVSRPDTSCPGTPIANSESDNSDSARKNDFTPSKTEPVRRSQRQLDKIEREQVEKIRAENAAMQRREIEEMEKLKSKSSDPEVGDIIEKETSDEEKSLASLLKEGVNVEDIVASPKSVITPNKSERKMSVESVNRSLDEDSMDKKSRKATPDKNKTRIRTDSETSVDDAKPKIGRSKSLDKDPTKTTSPSKITKKKSRASLEDERLAEELKRMREENAKKEAEDLLRKERAAELKRRKLKKEQMQSKLADFEPALFSFPDKIIKDKADAKNLKVDNDSSNELKLEKLDCPEAKKEIKEFKEKSEAGSSLPTGSIEDAAEPYNELALIANHLMESDPIASVTADSTLINASLTESKASHQSPLFVLSSDGKTLTKVENETPKKALISKEGLKEQIRALNREVLAKPRRKIPLTKVDSKVSLSGTNRQLTKEQKMGVKSKLANIDKMKMASMEMASNTKKKGYIVKHLLMKSRKQEQMKQARVERRPMVKKSDSMRKENIKSKQPVRKRQSSQRQKKRKSLPNDDIAYSDDSDDSDWDSEDDPEKLWCICRKPSNDRFMIQCDYCSDWFHGSCVNVTKQLGRQMEKEQKEWKCPRCIKGMPPVSAQPVLMEPIDKIKHPKKTVPEMKEPGNIAKTVTNVASQLGKCIMCKKPTQKDSIYCSAACIEKHGSEVLKLMPKDIAKPQGKAEVKAVQRILVVEKRSGKLLMGPNAPTNENIFAWLKANPSYEIVKPGPQIQQRRASESSASPIKKVVKPESSNLDKEKHPETVRQSIRKTLKEILVDRCKEADDIDVKEEEIKKIAVNIEEHLFRLFKDTGSKYKSRYRSLMFNVKDPRNQGLFRKIVKGKIPPDQLVKKTPEELASKELSMWREREAQHALEMIKKEQLEQLQNPTLLIKKTHKGEVEVQDDQLLIVEKDEKTDAAGEIAMEKALELGQMLADTTNEHRSHLFDLNCKICTGRTPAEAKEEKPKTVKVATTISVEKSEPIEAEKEKDKEKPEKSVKIEEPPRRIKSSSKHKKSSKKSKRSKHIHEEASDHEPSSTVSFGSPDVDVQSKKSKIDNSSKGPPSVWKGFIYMIDVAKFVTSALRVSGPTDCLNTDIPDSVQVCGRISPEEVWSYLSKIKQSGNKELIIVRFQPANEEERSTYDSFFTYLNSRKRYGVVKSSCKTIKDFYIIPLSSHTPVPTVLMPFNGPGLETNRPNLLLGVLVRHKAKNKSSSRSKSNKSSDKIEPYEPSYTPPLEAMPCQSTTVDSSNSTSMYQPTSLKPDKINVKRIKPSIDDEPYEPSYTPPLEKIPKLGDDDDKPYDPEENENLESSKQGLDIRSLLPILQTKSSLPPASATSLLTSVASAAITANTDLETQKKLLAELTREVEHQKEQIEQKNRSLVGNVSRILSSGATDSPRVGSLTPPNPPPTVQPPIPVVAPAPITSVSSPASIKVPAPIQVPLAETLKKGSGVLDSSGNLSANLQDIQIPDMLQSILNNIRGKPSTVTPTKAHLSESPGSTQQRVQEPPKVIEERKSSPSPFTGISGILGSSSVIPFLSDDTPKVINPPMTSSNKSYTAMSSDMELSNRSSPIPSFLVPQNKPLITTPVTIMPPVVVKPPPPPPPSKSAPPTKPGLGQLSTKDLLELAQRELQATKQKTEIPATETTMAPTMTAVSPSAPSKAGIHFTIKRLKAPTLPCVASPIVEPEPQSKTKIKELIPAKTTVPERSLTPPLPPPKTDSTILSKFHSIASINLPENNAIPPITLDQGPSVDTNTTLATVLASESKTLSAWSSVNSSVSSCPVVSDRVTQAAKPPVSSSSTSSPQAISKVALPQSDIQSKLLSIALNTSIPTPPLHTIPVPPSRPTTTVLHAVIAPSASVKPTTSPSALSTIESSGQGIFKPIVTPAIQTPLLSIPVPPTKPTSTQKLSSIPLPTTPLTKPAMSTTAPISPWIATGFTEPPPPGVESDDLQAKEKLAKTQTQQALSNQQYQSISYPSQSGYSVQSTFYNQPATNPYYMTQNPQWGRAPGSVGNIRPPLPGSWSQSQRYQHPQSHYQQSHQPAMPSQYPQTHAQPHDQKPPLPHAPHPPTHSQPNQPALPQQHPPSVTTQQARTPPHPVAGSHHHPQTPQQYRPRMPPLGGPRPWRPRWNGPNNRWNNGDRRMYDDYRRDWDGDSRSHSRGRNRSRDRSRSRDRNRSRDRSQSRGRSRSRDRSQSRGRSQSPDRSRSRDKSADRDSTKGKTKESPEKDEAKKPEEKPRERSASRNRSTSREKSPARSKSRSPSRERAKSRAKSRGRSKSLDKTRDRSRSYSRSRSRSRSRDRSRDRSRSRSRSRGRSRGKSRDRSWSRDRSYGRRDNWKRFRRYNGGRDRFRNNNNNNNNRRPAFWDNSKR